MDWEDRLHGLWAWIVFIVALMTIFGFVTDVFANGCVGNCEQSFNQAANVCQGSYSDPVASSYCVQSAATIYMVCVQTCGRLRQAINPDGSVGNQDLQGVLPQGDCPSSMASVDCRNKRAKRSYP